MRKNSECPKSSHSANFGGGGNFLSPNNEGLENGTAKPYHPEERSDVGIASSSKVAFTSPSRANLRTDVSPDSENMERAGHKPESDTVRAWSKFKTGMSEAKVEQESTETLSFRCDCERCRLVRGRKGSQAKKVAFTLAEVLITLGIIGIVAALTLPAFISNVQGRIQAKRVENINQKLSKVTDKMAVQSGLIGYPDTMAFVQEMKKHMSIAKVCDNSHLAECWGTTEVDVGKDKPWEISKTKTAKTLKIGEPDNWADTVGIVTADGTPMILSYDKECNFDVNNTGLQFDKSSGKSNSLACISGVFDWNGGARPNKLGDDVITLGMASGLGSSCAFEVNGTCYTAPFTPKPLTKAECEAQKDNLGIKACYYANDYWAGAVKQCDGVSKMPTGAQLAELASQLYFGNPTIGATENKSVIQFDYNSSTAKSLGLTPYFALWSGEERSSYSAYGRLFNATYSNWISYSRGISSVQAVCLGE